MESACLLFPRPDPKEEFRAMVRQSADEWVDSLEPLFRVEGKPSLSEISMQFQDTRLAFLGACTKAAVEQAHLELIVQVVADCPSCKKVLHRKRLDSKKISTMQGEFFLDRPYFYCSACKVGFHPLDEALGLAPGRHQFDVQEKAVKSASKMPFEESAEEFSSLTGVEVGNHFQHDTLNAVGYMATLELVIPDRDEIERRIDDVAKATNAGRDELRAEERQRRRDHLDRIPIEGKFGQGKTGTAWKRSASSWPTPQKSGFVPFLVMNLNLLLRFLFVLRLSRLKEISWAIWRQMGDMGYGELSSRVAVWLPRSLAEPQRPKLAF